MEEYPRFFLLNCLRKDPIGQKSIPDILLPLSDCGISESCFIFERRLVMEVWIKEMALKRMLKNIRKWSWGRAFLTDVRMGEMYFRPDKKADMAGPKAYLLVRGFLVARNINSLQLA